MGGWRAIERSIVCEALERDETQGAPLHSMLRSKHRVAGAVERVRAIDEVANRCARVADRQIVNHLCAHRAAREAADRLGDALLDLLER